MKLIKKNKKKPETKPAASMGSARAISMRLAFFSGVRKRRVLLMADVMVVDSGLAMGVPGATPTILITVVEARGKNVTAFVDNIRTTGVVAQKKETKAKK